MQSTIVSSPIHNLGIPSQTVPTTQSNIQVVVERFLNDASAWHRLKNQILFRPSLQTLFSQLQGENLKAVLNEIIKIGFEQNNPELIQRSLALINVDQLLKIANEILPADLETMFQWIEAEVQSQNRNSHQTSKEIPHTVRSFLHRFIETLLSAFSMFSINKEPTTRWEASQLITVYGQLAAIPLLFLTTLNAMLLPPLTALLITASIVAIVTASVFLYIKWRPFPEQVHTLRNPAEEKSTTQIPFIGRDEEIEDLETKISMGINVILKGAPGCGKSTIYKELCRRIAEGKVNEALKGKKPLAGYVIEILPKPFSNDGACAFQEILNRIERHSKDTIIILDNMHDGIKDDGFFSKLRNASDKPWIDTDKCIFIGVTTPEGYKDLVSKIKMPFEFERRFPGVIDITSLPDNDTLMVLNELARVSNPEIHVPLELIQSIIDKTNQLPNVSQPAISINVLTLALGIVKFQSDTPLTKKAMTFIDKTYAHKGLEFQHARGTPQEKEIGNQLLEQKKKKDELNIRLAKDVILYQKLKSAFDLSRKHKKDQTSLELDIIKHRENQKPYENLKKQFMLMHCLLQPYLNHRIEGIKKEIIENQHLTREEESKEKNAEFQPYVLTQAVIDKVLANLSPLATK